MYQVDHNMIHLADKSTGVDRNKCLDQASQMTNLQPGLQSEVDLDHQDLQIQGIT